jgi:hypothetical protein
MEGNSDLSDPNHYASDEAYRADLNRSSMSDSTPDIDSDRSSTDEGEFDPMGAASGGGNLQGWTLLENAKLPPFHASSTSVDEFLLGDIVIYCCCLFVVFCFYAYICDPLSTDS